MKKSNRITSIPWPTRTTANRLRPFTDRLDDIFGTIGDQSGLSALAGELAGALSSLVNQPGNYAAQQEVVACC
jgi:flagellar hook-associated protein 1 FlgK